MLKILLMSIIFVISFIGLLLWLLKDFAIYKDLQIKMDEEEESYDYTRRI
jgi:hypothetical protein